MISAGASGPVWALLPVKDFARAKSRLSAVLSGAERAALARRLCAHILSALGRCAAVDGILVLSDSQDVLRMVQEQGAHGEPQLDSLPAERTLGAIVDDGIQRLQRRGVQAAMIVMSDLPLASAEDFSQQLKLLNDHDWVIAPDLREQNTNALALRLGSPAGASIQTAFGSGDSFRLHVERAEQLGQRLAIHRAPGLGFDVDIPADYAELLTKGPWGL